MPGTGTAELSVYDAAGRLVMERDFSSLQPGEHHLTFDSKELSSGIYIATLQSGSESVSTKILLLK